MKKACTALHKENYLYISCSAFSTVEETEQINETVTGVTGLRKLPLKRPVWQWVWHVKELSLLNGHECRAQVKICSPSPAMVTSTYKCKILEWEDKLQQNKQNSYEYIDNSS